MSNYAAKIDAGIKLLDKEVPNWRDKIDVDKLDLGSCSVCVLGQVFGDYEDGVSQLGISGYEYGFNAPGDYQALTDAWKEALGKNNVLVEKGDVYKGSYGYAVRVLQTTFVNIEGKSTSVYIVERGMVDGNNAFTPRKDAKGQPELASFAKGTFEPGGAYSEKVEALKVSAGDFFTIGDKSYFAYSAMEARELKDNAWAVTVSTLDMGKAKIMKTPAGKTFGASIRGVLEDV